MKNNFAEINGALASQIFFVDADMCILYFACSNHHKLWSMRKRILVVDDDLVFIDVVTDLLASEGHVVVTAHNGKEALTVLAAQQVDAIISDVEMPVMDGMRLHAEISRNTRHKNIPFFFLTGLEEHPVFAYVKKHSSAMLIQKTELAEKMRTILASVGTQP